MKLKLSKQGTVALISGFVVVLFIVLFYIMGKRKVDSAKSSNSVDKGKAVERLMEKPETFNQGSRSSTQPEATGGNRTRDQETSVTAKVKGKESSETEERVLNAARKDFEEMARREAEEDGLRRSLDRAQRKLKGDMQDKISKKEDPKL